MLKELQQNKLLMHPIKLTQFIGAKVRFRLGVLKSIPWKDFFHDDQIFIFHHLPKCGGTSTNRVLENWFFVIKEHPEVNGTGTVPEKLDIERLKNYQCLSGHFDSEGKYLYQLHPEVFENDRYQLFTFIRNPLQTKISLYYHEKREQANKDISLEEHLLGRPNYIANRFPCHEDNYHEVLERYFFIGITEYLQQSLDQLAEHLNRPPIKVPVLRRSKREHKVESLSPALVDKFKSANRLDYLVYEYGLARFEGK